MADTLLKVDNINVYYGNIHAVKDISFEVDQGEIVTLIGANGAGKSTTLKTISGLLKPKTGDILYKGSDRHELDTAATGRERQRPQRIGTPPVDQLIQLADDDVHSARSELFNVLVVIERVVFHRLDVDSFYFHSKAPFFHA